MKRKIMSLILALCGALLTPTLQASDSVNHSMEMDHAETSTTRLMVYTTAVEQLIEILPRMEAILIQIGFRSEIDRNIIIATLDNHSQLIASYLDAIDELSTIENSTADRRIQLEALQTRIRAYRAASVNDMALD